MSEEWFKALKEEKGEYSVEKVDTVVLESAEITVAKVRREGKELAVVFVYDKSGFKKRQTAVQNAFIVSAFFDDVELAKWLKENYSKVPSYDGEGVQSERAFELFKYLIRKQLPPSTTSDDP